MGRRPFGRIALLAILAVSLALPSAVARSEAQARSDPPARRARQPHSAAGGTSMPIVRNRDGRLEAFTLATDFRTVIHAWQVAPNGGWSPWTPLATLANDLLNLEVLVNADGRLELFVSAEGVGGAWHLWQVVAGGGWSEAARLGSPEPANQYYFSPVGTVDATGALVIFFQVCGPPCGDTGPPAPILYQHQLTPGGGWTDPQPVNAEIVAPAQLITAFLDGDQAVQVVSTGSAAAGPSSPILRNSSRVPYHWGISWSPTPGPTQVIEWMSVALNTDGRAELFVTGCASGPVGCPVALLHSFEITLQGWLSPWTTLAPAALAQPSVSRNVDGRLEVVYVDDHDHAAHLWQATPALGPWSAPAVLDASHSFGRFEATVPDADGRLEAFAGITLGTLWHAWQSAPATGPWTTFTPIT